MTSKKPVIRTITILLAYLVFAFLLGAIIEGDLEGRAQCCGLYGDYGLAYFPFPMVLSSELSHWGGGPTRWYPLGIALNILLPIVIAAVSYISLKRSAAKKSASLE